MQKNYDLTTILNNLRIESLNEMQETTIEATGKNDHVLLLSPTGSGKTVAFLISVLNNIEASKKTQAMIIVPSRELALQIESVFRSMGTGLKITCCYGGHKREIEENNLIQPPAIIVGTPGRLADHIRRNNITVDSIHTLVLDEFDKSLEMGFVEEISFILSSLSSIKKKILTSATEATEIPDFIGFTDPARIDLIPEGEKQENKLAIQSLSSPDKDKAESLFRLICFLGNRSMVIFCNHRESVERTSALLSGRSITNTFYHGAMEQRDREMALAKFRNGSINILVTTDLASRGLDVPNIRYIIHFHLPPTEEVFTHRNGRTARMEASGTVILILGPEEKLPGFIQEPVEAIELPEELMVPEKPKWTTIFIAAGKKDKINKVDIVGFLTKQALLKKEDIGLIEVKDFFAFAAVRKSRVGPALELIKDQKLKNRKIKIEVAK
jgi:superfamily II DNA/RNA helicase